MKIIIFTALKNRRILHGRVFVMDFESMFFGSDCAQSFLTFFETEGCVWFIRIICCALNFVDRRIKMIYTLGYNPKCHCDYPDEITVFEWSHDSYPFCDKRTFS